jgi:hypothetical protein
MKFFTKLTALAALTLTACGFAAAAGGQIHVRVKPSQLQEAALALAGTVGDSCPIATARAVIAAPGGDFEEFLSALAPDADGPSTWNFHVWNALGAAEAHLADVLPDGQVVWLDGGFLPEEFPGFKAAFAVPHNGELPVQAMDIGGSMDWGNVTFTGLDRVVALEAKEWVKPCPSLLMPELAGGVALVAKEWVKPCPSLVDCVPDPITFLVVKGDGAILGELFINAAGRPSWVLPLAPAGYGGAGVINPYSEAPNPSYLLPVDPNAAPASE